MTKPHKSVTSGMVVKVLRRCATNVSLPEEKLWLAVLCKAIEDSTTKTYRQECRRFFMSEGFARICHFVGLDPIFARETIAKMR